MRTTERKILMIEIEIIDNHHAMLNVVTYLELNWTTLEVTVKTEQFGVNRIKYTIQIRRQ